MSDRVYIDRIRQLEQQVRDLRDALQQEQKVSAWRKMTLVHIAGFTDQKDIDFAPQLASGNLFVEPGG